MSFLDLAWPGVPAEILAGVTAAAIADLFAGGADDDLPDLVPDQPRRGPLPLARHPADEQIGPKPQRPARSIQPGPIKAGLAPVPAAVIIRSRQSPGRAAR
jgi:hypothetical protein